MELSPEMMQKLEFISMVAGVVVTLLSGVASLLNHIIRKKTDAGEEVSKGLITAASVLNFLAVNLDKGVQLAKMATGKPVPVTAALPAPAPAPAPAPTEPPKAS